MCRWYNRLIILMKKTALFIISALSLIFMSCSKDNNDSQAEEKTNPPVGTWSANEDGTKSFFNIYSNGTYIAAYYDGNNDNYKRVHTVETGYWNIDKTATTISFAKTGGSATIYSIQTMNENLIILLNMTSGTTLSFQKRTDDRKASDFVGKWTCNKTYSKEYDRYWTNLNYSFELKSDGTGVGFPGGTSYETFSYYYMGGMLICRYNNAVWGFRVNSKYGTSMNMSSKGSSNYFDATHYYEYWLSK